MNNFEWVKKVAEKYDISDETVWGFFVGWDNRLCCENGRFLSRRERTERFFDLYFEGRNEQ